MAAAVEPSRSTHPSRPPAHPALWITEDAFIAEPTVDGWVRAGIVTRDGALLVTEDGRRFLLRDAIRVLGRRNGDTDHYGFTGRVAPIRDFIKKGASITIDTLRLGLAVFDIEYGVVATAA